MGRSGSAAPRRGAGPPPEATPPRHKDRRQTYPRRPSRPSRLRGSRWTAGNQIAWEAQNVRTQRLRVGAGATPKSAAKSACVPLSRLPAMGKVDGAGMRRSGRRAPMLGRASAANQRTSVLCVPRPRLRERFARSAWSAVGHGAVTAHAPNALEVPPPPCASTPIAMPLTPDFGSSSLAMLSKNGSAPA